MQGLDIDGTFIDEKTPIEHSVRCNSLIMIKTLALSGAQVNDTIERDYNHSKPIHSIDYKWQEDRIINTLRILIKLGADPNAVQKSWYEWDMTTSTPLHTAASHGCDLAIRTLVELGANINQTVIQFDGNSTPLHKAIKQGRFKAVQTLIELGADPFSINLYGQNALALAMKMKKDDENRGVYSNPLKDIISFLEQVMKKT